MLIKSIHFWKKVIVWGSIILLIILFIYAAYNKIAIYNTFVRQLEASPVIGKSAWFLAWFIPGIEILIALLLILKKTRLLGLYSSFYLMLVFTIYVYVIPHFFKSPGCSCGGIISSFTWKQHFWFNLGFTLLAGAGLVLSSTLKRRQESSS